MREFNNKEVELLAPAGNFSILRDLVNTPCDTLYIGGKQFNMRMHRNNFNFSNSELKNAIDLSHEHKKRIYITINNLMTDNEVSSCLDYLYYLEDLNPDGVIIQDFSIVSLIKEKGLSLPMHSSVMMNVHNESMIKKLYALGITRTVVSREVDLQTINRWGISTPMEFEYFVHGDMCSVRGSQCYYSNLTFGKSSNRGMCMKPCRWKYMIQYKGQQYAPSFPLAVKDMYMYENVPEMINAGVCSFKIEGRMREADYLKGIINAYGDTIDRYIDDPIYYDREKGKKDLYENRMRDFSTAYAFEKPQLDFNNHRYEGTGFFYSTGKVFSHPIEEFSIKSETINEFKDSCSAFTLKKTTPKLSVRVDTLSQLEASIQYGIDFIYINTDNFVVENGLSMNSIMQLSKHKKNSKLILALPKITDDESFEKFDVVFNQPDFVSELDGLMVSNIGVIERYKNSGLPLYGDITLNIYNNTSKAFYIQNGLKNIPLSIEMKRSELIEFSKHNNNTHGVEIIVHGSPTMMYMDLDVHLNIEHCEIIKTKNNQYFSNDTFVMVDEKGFEHPVYRDTMGKNHMMLYKDICLLPLMEDLQRLGINIYRLEISHYPIEEFRTILNAYKEAITDFTKIESIFNQLKPNHLGFSLGSLQF